MATERVEGRADPVLTNPMRHGARRGLVAGLWAGFLFLLGQAFVSVALYGSALWPFRMFASVVLGSEALISTSTSTGTAIAVGTLLHVLLSGSFGMLYGELRFRSFRQASLGRDAALGAGYGALLWLIDFQLVARWLRPWLLDTPQLTQLVIHVLFYGVPLGVLCRRAPVWLESLDERSPA